MASAIPPQRVEHGIKLRLDQRKALAEVGRSRAVIDADDEQLAARPGIEIAGHHELR